MNELEQTLASDIKALKGFERDIRIFRQDKEDQLRTLLAEKASGRST